MQKIQEPLRSLKNYSENNTTPKKTANIYFTDVNFQPLLVDKTKIASSKEMKSFNNHLQFLPRIGDSILVGKNTLYKVKNVIHSLPCIRSDIQKIYIVLE